MIFNRTIVTESPRREDDKQGKYDRRETDDKYTKRLCLVRTDHQDSITLEAGSQFLF